MMLINIMVMDPGNSAGICWRFRIARTLGTADPCSAINVSVVRSLRTEWAPPNTGTWAPSKQATCLKMRLGCKQENVHDMALRHRSSLVSLSAPALCGARNGGQWLHSGVWSSSTQTSHLREPKGEWMKIEVRLWGRDMSVYWFLLVKTNLLAVPQLLLCFLVHSSELY